MHRDRLSGIVYLILLAALAVAGARCAGSNYFAKAAIAADSLDEAATAIRYQPENPGAHEAYGLGLLQRNEFVEASEAFTRAVSLSPNDYRLWLRLAKAQTLGGESGSAETAYSRAVELAPDYSLPNIELGRMYLERGQLGKAFQFLGAAARLDQSYYAEVLKSANAAFGDNPEAIERAVGPISTKGKSIVAWYFVDRSWMTERTRAFLLSDEPTLEEKNTFIRFLRARKNYPFAREVWLSRLATDGQTADATAAIFDGGFELTTASDSSGFGWQIDQGIPSTSITLDRKNVHSGQVALNIRLAGNVELRRPLVSQLAVVVPGKRYTVSFFFRAGELVSAGLPAILVTDPLTNVILGRSDAIEDSKGAWIQRSVAFTAPTDGAVVVSFQRPDCQTQPCPIFGEVSIDDLAVTPGIP